MTGKFKLILLTLCLLCVAAAAQAGPLFPFAPGYTATYSFSQGDQTQTVKMQVTGTTNLGGYQWYVVNIGTTPRYFRATGTELYSYGDVGPDFQTGQVNFSWSFTGSGDPGPTTATIVAIGPLTVPAGTFSNVYTVHKVTPSINDDYYQYWKPGVGLLKETDSYANPPYTEVLTGLTLGAKTAALGLLLDN